MKWRSGSKQASKEERKEGRKKERKEGKKEKKDMKLRKKENRNSQHKKGEYLSTTNPLLRNNDHDKPMQLSSPGARKEPLKYVVDTVLMLPDYRRHTIDSRSPTSQPDSSNIHRPYDYDNEPGGQYGHYNDPVCSVTQAYVVVPNSGVKYDYDHNNDLSPTSPVSPTSPTNPNYRREKFCLA